MFHRCPSARFSKNTMPPRPATTPLVPSLFSLTPSAMAQPSLSTLASSKRIHRPFHFSFTKTVPRSPTKAAVAPFPLTATDEIISLSSSPGPATSDQVSVSKSNKVPFAATTTLVSPLSSTATAATRRSPFSALSTLRQFRFTPPRRTKRCPSRVTASASLLFSLSSTLLILSCSFNGSRSVTLSPT